MPADLAGNRAVDGKKSTRNPAYLTGSTKHSSVSRTLKSLFASNDAPSTTDKKSSMLGWLSSKSLTSGSKKQGGGNKPTGRKYGKVHPEHPAAASPLPSSMGDVSRIDTMALQPLQFRAFCGDSGILTEKVQGAQQQQLMCSIAASVQQPPTDVMWLWWLTICSTVLRFTSPS